MHGYVPMLDKYIIWGYKQRLTLYLWLMVDFVVKADSTVMLSRTIFLYGTGVADDMIWHVMIWNDMMMICYVHATDVVYVSFTC